MEPESESAGRRLWLRNLIEQIGGATITEIETYHARVLKEIRLAAEKDRNRQRTAESTGALQLPLKAR